jgi:hypothetical protein
MKNIILTLLIVLFVSAKDFDQINFDNMNNDSKFDYCNKRYEVGHVAHNKIEEDHKNHPDFIKEQQICCGIDREQLSKDKQSIYDNDWECAKPKTN